MFTTEGITARAIGAYPSPGAGGVIGAVAGAVAGPVSGAVEVARAAPGAPRVRRARPARNARAAPARRPNASVASNEAGRAADAPAVLVDHESVRIPSLSPRPVPPG